MPTLDWLGKSAVVNHHHEVPFHLLKCDDKLSVGDPGSGNLLVQGDNLLALKALLPYYAGQVKCIYIDPPYNTGNENWVYNDNVNSPEIKEWLGKVVGGEGEDLGRHDKWLCMMYPRLQLLHQMLRADGSFWMSIDDNEIHNARAILDEIFGNQNFVANVIWEKSYAPKSSAKHLSDRHEHILLYARDKDNWHRNLLPRTEQQDRLYKNPDNDPRGLWRPNNLAARNYYGAGTYSIKTPSGRVILGPPKGSYWRVSEERFWELDSEGRIWWGEDGNNVPAPKIYLSEVKQGIVPETIWFFKDVGHSQEGKKEIIKLLPTAADVFTTPKPTRLIQRILQIATNPGDIALDSFAGSGTTGHAVLQMNANVMLSREAAKHLPIDGETLPHSQRSGSASFAQGDNANGGAVQGDMTNRRFVLIEIESGIAKDITAQRLKRVINGYGDVDGLGGGFRYCTLGPTLFEAEGQIRAEVTFGELAQHVFFIETGEPLAERPKRKSPLLGVVNGLAVYLLYNGVLGDKSPQGGNVLTRALLADLPPHNGPKVIYGAGCRLAPERLKREGVTFRQIPYEVRVR